MVPHKDGLGFMALITTLESSLLLDLYHKPATYPITRTMVYYKNPCPELQSHEVGEPQFNLLMEPGSLLILTKDSFIHWIHGIDGRTVDVVTPKTINLHLLGGKYKIGDEIVRKDRISIAMWDSRKRAQPKLPSSDEPTTSSTPSSTSSTSTSTTNKSNNN